MAIVRAVARQRHGPMVRTEIPKSRFVPTMPDTRPN
ncbi:hypothetical protein GDI0850 [Gluconacetobacter diazotrophicus PA1 5]|uniref:Uncharacterized protein n=1 Tax=Gluconacetobacter diazotrophicus (strain ATCC 49037 / DSM 5601 / CCUG 37298 / CIP 103539 / LMG 7603 / PAl5) TaxID=272568 RepID=A9HBB6_GLUDA|nr:hypothetical protein GDI0850 [Gluconacetobacter diazotrophicus PA1 5]